jgi:hypothetical protein
VAPPIWTIEARENVMLDVISSDFGLSPERMQNEIRAAHSQTVNILASKGVKYEQLRGALTPRRDRYEFAFVFDSKTTDGKYGYTIPAQERILALLPAKDFSCSLLSGDLLIKNQELGFELLNRGLELHREVRPLGSTSELFAIYINNLTAARAEAIHSGLLPWNGYVGRIPSTYSSRTKDWLSTTLSSQYVKLDRTFIGQHEDDVSEDENYNLPGWPLLEHGFSCISLQSMYFGLFLSYKIERRVVPGETDTIHSLNAMSTSPQDLATFRVDIDEHKLAYLAEHGGSFRPAGLDTNTRDEIAELIRLRISQNYIYELHLKEHEGGTTSKFNIMLEFPGTRETPVRMQATIEYQPDERVLRVITLY